MDGISVPEGPWHITAISWPSSWYRSASSKYFHFSKRSCFEKKNVMLVSTLDKLGVEEGWRQKGSEPISRNYQEACQNAGANINPAENVSVNTETWFERFATRRRHFYALLINYYVRSPDDDGIRAISHSTDGFFSSSRFFFLFLVSGI